MRSSNDPLSPEALFLMAYPLAHGAAQVRSRNALGGRGTTALDPEDLKQDALLQVWLALSQFDRSRASLRTFIEHVIANKIASVRRSQRALQRTVIRFETVKCHPEAVALDTRIDVQTILAKLNTQDRQVAILLAEGTPTEVSRALCISRSTVYERIRSIRRVFVNAGFGCRKVSGAAG
jgi:RNA polymerase sigma factor (sigma-70 family)